MNIRKRFCAWMVAFIFCSFAAAAAAEEASPVTGVVKDKIRIFTHTLKVQRTFSGSEPVTISFCDSKLTTRTPKNEQNLCVQPTRSLKLDGTKTEALKIEPETKGEWRFTGDYALTFTPAQPWKAEQVYRVTYQPTLFPSHIKLTDKGYSFSTQPLYLLSKDMNYLQDPNDVAKKFATAQLAFNYPIKREALKAALSFAIEGKPEKLPFTVGFDAGDMNANVTIPVSRLEEQAQFITLNVNPSLVTADGSGSLKTYLNVTNPLSQRVMIPSLYDYMQITSTSVSVLKNSRYVPQQTIALESNTAIDPKDIAQFAELRLLPKDKPIPNLSPKKDYMWSQPTEVTPEVRATSSAVPFELNKEAEPSLINAITFSADSRRYILLTLKKGMPAPGGYKLGNDFETILQVPALTQEVKVMAKGALLSLSGEKTLSVLSIGVPKIEYEIGRVKEENLSHLISQTRGSFSNPQFNSFSFDENNISQIFREERHIENVDPKLPNYSSFDFSQYIKEGKGLYFLNIKGKAPQTPQAEATAKPEDRVVGTDRRFILITDLGLIVKQNGDGSWDAFVQSIAGSGAVSGVNVQVLGTNGEKVAEAQTDSDGHATLPNLDALKDEKKPVAFVARKGSDLSFLPYGRYERELNYSKFDVSGDLPREGLRAYLFNDRGIYRPGETAHIGMIVKARDWAKTAAGLPLILEVTNPRGQVVSKQTLQLNAEGIMSADFTASETAATGIYYATLYLGREANEIGSELGNVALRVEEFMPDRMKMTSSLQQDGKNIDGLAWVKPEQLTADVTLMHLYGAPAVARRVTGKLTIAPGGFGFQSYKDYSFNAEGSVDKSFDEVLPETVTDAEGKAKFDLNLTKYGKSTFRMNFLGEGFEPDSGRSVKTSKGILVSPLDFVVGTKSDGNLNYINPSDTRKLSLVAVNASLQKVEAKDLTIELQRIKDVQTLTKTDSGNYEYSTSTIESSIKKDPLQIGAEGLDYALPTDKPGSYAVIIRNAQEIVLAKERFTVVGEGNASGDFTRDATMQVTPDKQAYKAGEDITLNIQSPYTGTGLITIETDKVHAWKWFTSTTTSSVQKIQIPAGFEGKGFVNVQFTRDLKSKEIFMSPLSFAVVPFTANVEARDQKVTLDAPKDIRPGDTVTVTYRSKEAGKIMLYAVDEGILQYGRYQNPDPLDHFLMKRGLEVKTSQIMDLLLPEYSLLKSLSLTGGDGFANDGKNLNPFKRKTQPPVAYWSGLLDSGPEAKDWKFTVPNYFNGSVRIIAVSVSVNAMGVTEAGVNVRGPLVVTPNLPLFSAPGDVFTATATVANYVKDSGADAKVKLAVEVSPHLQIVEAPSEPLPIAEGKEATVQIKLKASEVLGSGEMRLTASSGSDNFTIEQTMSVRPPVASMTALISGYAKEETKAVPQPRVLYPELSEMKASVSSLPVSLIGGLKEYLAKYPYGCTEQMTSQNFPNAVLYGNTELIQAFGWKPEEMESALQVSFDNLRERQSSNGGWGMWNYYSQPNAFISSYVMHFMIVAREKNLPVPQDVYDNGLRNLKQTVNEQPSSLEDAREKMYGIYLLTRAGEITSNYIPHLVSYLENYHPSIWHDDLVAVYLAATYQQMQMQPEAEELLKAFHLAKPVTYTTSWHEYAFYDSLTKYSQYVYLIARHFPKHLETMDKEVIWRVANYVGEGSYNTVSSSYAVMAIDAYVTARKDALAKVSISAKGTDGKDQVLEVLGEKLKVAMLKAPASELTFTSETPGFFYQIASSGYDKILPDKPLSAGLELKRSYTGEDGKPVKQVKLGDVVIVNLTLRSGNNDSIPNVAVVDLLPGGFELEPEAKIVETPAPAASEEEGEGEAAPAVQSTPVDASQWSPDSVDRREDRIILYGRFTSTESSYRYRMKATSKGTFITPPAYAESMYDPALKARGVAGNIEVQ